MTSVVGPDAVLFYFPAPTSFSSTRPTRRRPFLLPSRYASLSLFLSLSLFFVSFIRFSSLVSSFFSARQESEIASALITTRPKSYMEFICHRHALRRDTTRYSSLLNPRTRKRASDGGNILSLFNLTARSRVLYEMYRDDFY